LSSASPVASATTEALRPSIASTDRTQSTGLHSEMSSKRLSCFRPDRMSRGSSESTTRSCRRGSGGQASRRSRSRSTSRGPRSYRAMPFPTIRERALDLCQASGCVVGALVEDGVWVQSGNEVSVRVVGVARDLFPHLRCHHLAGVVVGVGRLEAVRVGAGKEVSGLVVEVNEAPVCARGADPAVGRSRRRRSESCPCRLSWRACYRLGRSCRRPSEFRPSSSSSIGGSRSRRPG
jgi:hypothetical protein